MKKIVKYLFLVLILIMLFSNTSKSEFLNEINESKDPLSEYYSLRTFKNAKVIIDANKKYFSPVFILDYTNLGIFSIADVEYGWMGTLRIDGKELDKYVNKISEKTYLIFFGKPFELYSSSPEE